MPSGAEVGAGMAELVPVGRQGAPGDAPASEAAWFEPHRRELVGYCYRMLGSGFEAEDAVQETLLRAWQSLDRFDERRSAWRSWLFTIATNVCLDMLRAAQRRARAMDLGPASQGAPDLGAVLPESRWVYPMADRSVLREDGDPAELAAQRDTIRLAFIAALQHLPARQRAVLILRDVLRWKADEVGQLLGVTVPAVNSALQRARATLAARSPRLGDPVPPVADAEQQRLVRRYVDAFERHDVETLVSLLHEDAITSMPPFVWWLRGRAAIGRVMAASDACRGDRFIPTRANGTVALGQYRRGGPDGAYEPFALVVVETAEGVITETTTYLGASRLFPSFGLPLGWQP